MIHAQLPTRRQPLRLWPGVTVVALQWLIWLGLPRVAPETGYLGAMGGLAGGLLVVVWWAFLSRAPLSERGGAIVLMIAALVATSRLAHVSISTGGRGMLFYVYAIPVLSLAFVVWAAATRHLADRPRRVAMVATILLACGVWTLVRTHGVSSSGSEFAWRWAQTPEERLLARAEEPTAVPPAAALVPAGPSEGAADLSLGSPGHVTPAAEAETRTPEPETPPPDWPGFRGPDRDSVIRDVAIETDWSAAPPVELWRRAIGPGWSSFAIHGGLLYTQEQRGDDEVVSCYRATTGEPVWHHRDAARFWESNAGPGPRATPTASGGRVYTLGATAILNALDAADGAVVWSRDAASDTDAEKRPYWGFAGSPLVVDDDVVAAVSGTLVAYDLANGELRWRGPDGGISYSSPQLLTIDGVEQILLLGEGGATSVAPADGTTLWRHAWPGFSIVQPALTADGDLLLSADEVGTRRIAATRGPGGWTTEERWTSSGLKSNYNDFVVYGGYAFGFDGSILACVDVADGVRRWKGGRYGAGQLLLLADQGLLLVLSEKGELALVEATPDRFTELARLPAIAGKTWNHPVLAGDLLVVRNGQEMAAFRLALARG